MKKIFILLPMSCLMAACASWQPMDWNGQNFDNYILSKGVPTSQYTSPSGNIIYSFKTICEYDLTKTEETLVTVDQNNLIQNISTPTQCPSYYDSPEYKHKQEMERTQKANEKRIKDLKKSIEGIELDISLRQTLIKSAQTDIELAKMRKNETALAEAEGKLKEAQQRLNEDQKYKVEWENELKRLQSM